MYSLFLIHMMESYNANGNAVIDNMGNMMLL